MGGFKNSPVHRRVSPRLQNVPDDERPLYTTDRKRTPDAATEIDVATNKKPKVAAKPSSPPLQKSKPDKKSGKTKIRSAVNWFAPAAPSTYILLCSRFRESLRHFNLRWGENAGPGLPELVSKESHSRRIGSKLVPSDLPGLVCKDISNGQESLSILATNVVDVPPVTPDIAGVTYTNSLRVAADVNIPPNADGCNCKGSCTDPLKCSCAKLNGSDFPYVDQDGGRLIEAKAVVFECGPNCGCGPCCVNRTSQQGLKYRLEVYRTHNKGWAVRSWDFIPSGAPVCEYTGVLRKNDEVEMVKDKDNVNVNVNVNVSHNDYIFEIDCWHTMNGIGAREKRMCDVTIPGHEEGIGSREKLMRDVTIPGHEAAKEDGFHKESDINEPEFCIDAGKCGNVARYINHSCEPNLFVQCVLRSHHDVGQARIVLFAADDIAPFEELTYDYGYELDSVVSADGKIKKLPCYCGTPDCRKRLY